MRAFSICFLLAFAEYHAKSFHDRLRDIVLNGEDVLHLAVVALRPQMITVGNVHELSGDAKAVAHLADAALENRRDLQLPSDLADVLVLSLERERRRARRDAQRLNLGQSVDDLFRHAVGEVFVLRIGAHVRERQHRDRFCG